MTKPTDWAYAAGTQTGRGNFTPGTSFSKQPRSLLFCNNPTDVGYAQPNPPRSQMVADTTTGVIPATSWNIIPSSTNDDTQTNLGFDTV